MNRSMRVLFLITLLLGSVQSLQAQRVKKGYEALSILDYFKAKKMFSKGLKYNPEASSFGLSVVFARNNNPFYNLDSAYHYVVMSDTMYLQAKEKKREKWAVYGWTRSGIDSMMQVIGDLRFTIAVKEHTVDAYTTFMDQHPWSNKYKVANYKRDSLAFFTALNDNSSEAYKAFLDAYPESEFAEIAKDNFYNSQFFEKTDKGSVQSFVEFIEQHPSSPMRRDAEEAIYELVTKPNTLSAYELFILGYDTNPYVGKAWKEYFQLFISDYGPERIEFFIDKYPDSPVLEEAEKELAWCDYSLLPYSVENVMEDKGNLYGFMNTDGKEVLECKFEFAGAFNEGLAMVMMNGKYGFINKMGDLKIPCEYEGAYDFKEGRAVVEMNGKLGMIDRNNKLLVPFEYEDIGEMSEHKAYVSKGEFYGYVDQNGELIIPEKFDEAFNFKDNLALVQFEDQYGFIAPSGQFVIQPNYEELTSLTDSLVLCVVDGRKGILTNNGTVVIQPIYDQIGHFKDGLALVSHGDTVEYINIHGEVVLSKGYRTYPNFLLKGTFSEGAAIVMNKKGKYGRINTYGNVITEYQYDNLGLSNQFIPFEKEEMWGLMNTSNKILISPRYESIDVLGENYILGRSEEGAGVMDPNGTKIIDFTYDEIEYLGQKVFVTENNGKYGMYLDGTMIAEPLYDKVSRFNEDFVLLVKDNMFFYFSVKKKTMINSAEGE